MMYLSDKSLTYALECCTTIPKYQVRIVVKSISQAREIVNSMARNNLHECYEYGCGNHIAWIKFKNGSLIRFVTVNDKARGYKFNLLIADSEINKKLLMSSVVTWMPLLEPYINKRSDSE